MREYTFSGSVYKMNSDKKTYALFFLIKPNNKNNVQTLPNSKRVIGSILFSIT